MKKYLLSTTIAAVAFSSAAMAQQQAQAQQSGLEEIVVTAQRREEQIQNVPIPVSAFSAEMLAKRQIVQATDLERYVPSLKMRNNITSPTNISPALRGSTQQDASLIVAESPFGLYVDDVYLGRLNGNNVTLADIERVEALRGPQGTLYGRNTLAGAIKFITRTPSQDDEWVKAEAMYGTYDNYKASVSVGGGLTDTVAGSFAAQINGKGGYWTNQATNTPVGDEDNTAARGKLRYTGSDVFDATVSASFSRSTNDGLQLTPGTTPGVATNRQYRSKQVVPLYGNPYVVNRPVSNKSPSPIENNPRGNTKQWISSLNMTYDFGDASLQSITAFVNTRDFFSTDFTGTGGVGVTVSAANGGSLGGVVGATKLNADQLTQELKVQGEAAGGKLNYLVGGFFLQQRRSRVGIDKHLVNGHARSNRAGQFPLAVDERQTGFPAGVGIPQSRGFTHPWVGGARDGVVGDHGNSCAAPGRQKYFVRRSNGGVARRGGEDTPNAPRASADPGSVQDCFAGCEAQHQQTAFAKKKSHDAMFFVNTDAEEPVGGTRRSR